MSRSRAFLSLEALLVCGLLTPVVGDTVYLKNGAWIDGIVRARTEKAVEIEIGKIGKVEIAAEDIHEIEKNNRTGAEYQQPSDMKKQALGIVTKDGKNIIVPTKEKKPGDGPPSDASGEAGDKNASSTKADASKEKDKGKDEKGADEADGGKGKDKKKKKEDEIDPELKTRIQGLVDDLLRQKPNFRVRAERHLKAIGQPSLPFLLPVAKNESEMVRTAVFRLLEDFGDESVLDASIDALLDSNEYVRESANRTLQRVTHEDFGFQAAASPRRRETAHDKWKKWWAAEKEELAREEKMKG